MIEETCNEVSEFDPEKLAMVPHECIQSYVRGIFLLETISGRSSYLSMHEVPVDLINTARAKANRRMKALRDSPSLDRPVNLQQQNLFSLSQKAHPLEFLRDQLNEHQAFPFLLMHWKLSLISLPVLLLNSLH